MAVLTVEASSEVILDQVVRNEDERHLIDVIIAYGEMILSPAGNSSGYATDFLEIGQRIVGDLFTQVSTDERTRFSNFVRAVEYYVNLQGKEEGRLKEKAKNTAEQTAPFGLYPIGIPNTILFALATWNARTIDGNPWEHVARQLGYTENDLYGLRDNNRIEDVAIRVILGHGREGDKEVHFSERHYSRPAA